MRMTRSEKKKGMELGMWMWTGMAEWRRLTFAFLALLFFLALNGEDEEEAEKKVD